MLYSDMASLMDYDPSDPTSHMSRPSVEEYDTNFAAEINSKMRVPHRITTHDSPEIHVPRNYRDEDVWTNQETAASMQIPHRLVMNDLPMGVPEQQSTNRGSTFEERPFPASEELRDHNNDDYFSLDANCNNNNNRHRTSQERRSKFFASQDGSTISADPQVNELSTSLLDPEGMDDLDKTRRQVARLIRHVRHLERENSRRVSRELLLYPVVISYFIYKAAKWFMKQL